MGTKARRLHGGGLEGLDTYSAPKYVNLKL